MKRPTREQDIMVASHAMISCAQRWYPIFVARRAPPVWAAVLLVCGCGTVAAAPAAHTVPYPVALASPQSRSPSSTEPARVTRPTNRWDKRDGCNAAISVINDVGETIRVSTATMNASEDDTQAILDVARAMDLGAGAVDSLDLADETLRGLADEYVRMLRKGARAIRKMVDAANANDLQRLKQAMSEISEVEPTDSDIVDRVSAYCSDED